MTERIREFLRDRRAKGLDVEPCLVVDLEVVRTPEGRLCPVVVERPVERTRARPSSSSVWVASGGARGVTATTGIQQSKYAFNYPVHSGMVEWTGSLKGRLIGRTRLGVVDRLVDFLVATFEEVVYI